MGNAKRDENYVTTLLAVSNADGVTPVVLYADPTTHRLLVSIAGGGSVAGSDTQVQFNDAGAFGGDAGFTYNKTTDTATLAGPIQALTANLSDSDASHYLVITASSNLSANRILSLVTGDAARTLTFAGNLNIAADFITSGANSLTLTTTGATNVTLPTTGTLGTLAGIETLTNKTLTAPAINSGTIGTSLVPTSDDGAALGNTTHNFSDLFLASEAVVNYANGDVVITHTAGILTMGTGDFRITTAGTNAASVVTVGGTQTLTNKTLTSPTLTTPALGVATATSINGLTITASTGTITITNGKVLTISNSLTFTGTDSSSVAFGTGGTVAYVANKLSVFAATSSSELAGVISDETGSGALVFGTNPTIAKPVMDATNPTAQTYSPAGGGTATLDLSLANQHRITMPAGNITIALSNDTNSQIFMVAITQDSVGSRTVTWFTTIKWASGVTPTLTTTANKRDIFGFIRTGSGTYDGFIVGQNI